MSVGECEVIVGMGSSDPQAILYFQRAIMALRLVPNLDLRRQSSVYLSDAMLPPGEVPSDWKKQYYNMAVLLRSRFVKSSDLLQCLKNIETSLGRITQKKWAPRVIDLDILSMGSLSCKESNLSIPHPGLLQRPFALVPHFELSPKWKHPDQSLRVHDSLEKWSKMTEWPFRTRHSTLSLTQMVGIVNLTPDSFSDGKEWNESQFEDQVQSLILQGAQVLDFGAESTRPGAKILGVEEECRRIARIFPLLKQFKSAHSNLEFSLDSRNADTVAWALDAFAWDYINDVNGFADSSMFKVVQSHNCRLVAMHSLSVPPQKDLQLATNCSASRQVLQWGISKIEEFASYGIPLDRICLDPGIGFGKSVAQNYELIANAEIFLQWRVPVWWGHSRKSFMSQNGVVPPSERDLETAQLSAELELRGADFLRVHNIESSLRAIYNRKSLLAPEIFCEP